MDTYVFVPEQGGRLPGGQYLVMTSDDGTATMAWRPHTSASWGPRVKASMHTHEDTDTGAES